MKLLVQPEDGIKPLLEGLRKAKKTIHILIFRFDRPEIEKELVAAVQRGVTVHALIAYTNQGEEKNLRRLEMRLKELLSGVPVDSARLSQEAALLAERSDISEELDRLRSHLTQFDKLLAEGGEIGKKLDFLLQEMHREANTLLSKTPGVESEGLAITGLALEIKAEIEKLREQVQNIE